MSTNQPGNGTYGVFTVPQVAAHYRFPSHLTGAGQRIAILEFYGGYHDADLDAYFQELGMAKPGITDHMVEARDHGLPIPAANSPLKLETLTAIIDDWRKPGATIAAISAKYGKDFGVFVATLECTMDVAIAASIAPGAGIDVYFAPRTPEAFGNAIRAALKSRPTVISLSWGRAEVDGWQLAQMLDIDAALAEARQQGVTVCCASGDEGSRASRAKQVATLANVQFPASSPNVLACGGTRLLHAEGSITGEVAWNEVWLDLPRASGGGMSGVFAKPQFQAQIRTPRPGPGIWIGGKNDPERFDGRWIPDVAANAHSDSGYKIILGGERFMAHESSAAAPLWAGLIALLAEGYGKPLPWMPELLYSPEYAQALNDITQGDNKLGDDGGARYFEAGTGWDACTGLGSPNGAALLAALTQ